MSWFVSDDRPRHRRRTRKRCSEHRGAWRRYVGSAAPSRNGLALLSRLDEPLEERAEFAGPEKILRVPLHAEAEARFGILDDFDDSVRCSGRHDESASDILHGLMMPAVHYERPVDTQPPHQPRVHR